MVHHNYLVLFCTLCCPLDTGFRLWENAVGKLELLSGQKFPNRKWRKPCISTFKRTQQNISQRWSHVRLYGPLHVYHLPALGGTRGERSLSLFYCEYSKETQATYTIECTSPKSEWSKIQASDQLASKKLYFGTSLQDTDEICGIWDLFTSSS